MENLIATTFDDDEEVIEDLQREIKEDRYEYSYLTDLELKYELEDEIRLKNPNYARLLALVIEGAKRA